MAIIIAGLIFAAYISDKLLNAGIGFNIFILNTIKKLNGFRRIGANSNFSIWIRLWNNIGHILFVDVHYAECHIVVISVFDKRFGFIYITDNININIFDIIIQHCNPSRNFPKIRWFINRFAGACISLSGSAIKFFVIIFINITTRLRKVGWYLDGQRSTFSRFRLSIIGNQNIIECAAWFLRYQSLTISRLRLC